MTDRWTITVCDECGAQLSKGWAQHQVFPDAGKGVTHRRTSQITVVRADAYERAVEALRVADDLLRRFGISASDHSELIRREFGKAQRQINDALGGR